MVFPRSWYPGDPPRSWEACLGLGLNGRPSPEAREAVAVRLHARSVESAPRPPVTYAHQTPPAADDVSRLKALFGTELAHATLPDTPWAALLPSPAGKPEQRQAGFAERVRAVLGLRVGEAADRVRPLIALFDDASLGLTGIGRAGFRSLYMDVHGHADSWTNYVAEESGFVEFAQNAKLDRDFREARLGADNLVNHRSLYAHIHRQFCEAVAFFAVCRRDPAVLLDLGHNPRQGWVGWLAESAEYMRAGFGATSEGYDFSDEFHVSLIGHEGRARANFGCLALLARDCYEPVPAGGANYVKEPAVIDRIAGRFLESCPPPRSDAVVLVGEIAMLLTMLPEDQDEDLHFVLEMLGFPPGRRHPWGWRIWLDRLSGALLGRLNALPGC